MQEILDQPQEPPGAMQPRREDGRGLALVTGANSGIGKEIARQLLSFGFAVYVGSRDAGRGQAAVDELGDDARLLVLDVTDAQSVVAAASQVAELDVLVNNAGISDAGQPPPETDVSTLRRVYETNVFGVVAVTNAFLPALRRSTHPRIVNVSSGTGSLGWSTDPTLSSITEYWEERPRRTAPRRRRSTRSPSITPRRWPPTVPSRSTPSPPGYAPPT